MSDPIADRLALAQRLATEAGRLALRFFHDRDELEIETKGNPQNIVSRADRAVEALIRRGIGAAFPEDAILGEEDGRSEGKSGVTWVIDPIDGTSPFLAGLPHWCVALALVEGTTTVAGVIEVPVAEEQFTARRGKGAWLDGAPMRVRPGARLDNSLTAIGASHRTDPEHAAQVIGDLMRAGGLFYRNGSGALMLASVAAGRLGGYYEPHMHPWDCLAGMLMVAEAGGRCTTLPGPLQAGGLVMATAPGLWDDLARIAGV
ncbi:inositol monophosphatase family protein [Plastorhodobacter daqingensis]|uniref:Inositol monophosphatase family protein n=1 Tax=Plastorhodobacter daqingensis TaxID=1387281 RepID=A0ABW2UJP3_9RHOB